MNYSKLSDSEKQKILKELYLKDKKSFQQIAEQYDTYANKVRRDAIKYKIPIRDKSEAQKNALETGNHKHPTKGQKRDQSTKDKIGLSVLSNWKNLESAELDRRKQNAKKRWDSLSDDQKNNMIKMANSAVRDSSKTGSKLEKYLLKELLARGYKVDFHKEQALLNTKLQIDLFLPALNVAIEVDGPSHFLPVWGEDALKRNIKYDNKKSGLILGKGLVLIRIKQTSDFSPSRAKLILDDLISHIEKIKTKFPSADNRTIEIGE
jgi:very-short-patch-repair endonuclease